LILTRLVINSFISNTFLAGIVSAVTFGNCTLGVDYKILQTGAQSISSSAACGIPPSGETKKGETNLLIPDLIFDPLC